MILSHKALIYKSGSEDSNFRPPAPHASLSVFLIKQKPLNTLRPINSFFKP